MHSCLRRNGKRGQGWQEGMLLFCVVLCIFGAYNRLQLGGNSANRYFEVRGLAGKSSEVGFF